MPPSAFVAVVVPTIGLAWFWTTGRDVTAGDARTALCVHLLVLLIPALWAYFLFSEPIVYLRNDEHELASRGSFGHAIVSLAAPVATPVLALVFLMMAALRAFGEGAQPERSSAAEVLLWWLVSTPILLFWAAVLRAPTVVRVSEEGVRFSNVRFAEWERIVGYARRGSRFDLFHASNPRIPLVCIRLDDEADAKFFLERLQAHRVPEAPNRRAFPLLSICSVTASCTLVALGYAASLHGLRRAWILAAIFAAGVAAMAALDRLRGLQNVTVIRPVAEPESGARP